MTDGDVDMQANSGSLPTSTSDSSTLGLRDDELEPLTQQMQRYSERKDWLRKIKDDTDVSWCELLEIVLLTLTAKLASSTLKSKVIGPLTYQEAEDIVSGFSGEQLNKWKEATRKGVEKDDWTDLINLTKLKNPKLPNVAQGVPKELRVFRFFPLHPPMILILLTAYHGVENAVIDAWGRPYLGDAHQILLRAIDELHNLSSIRSYAKIIPIVQSSGTGKSKIVDRISTERILFPMCLREELGKDLFAYPLPDASIRDHLLHAPSADTELAVKQYLRKFLSSLFITALALRQNLFSGDGMTTYEEMARTFYAFFREQSQRSEFYEQVVRHAEKNPDADCGKHIRQLTADLKQHCSNWPTKSCPILISLDEVHGLYTLRKNEDKESHSLYSHFKSVLSELVLCSLGVICMSTASHISSLAPSNKTAPSVRERGEEISLPAPFTELPFDVDLIANPLAPGRENLKSVGSLEFTARFGRPLFYATYCSRKKEAGSNISRDILSIIQEKLSGRPWPPQQEASAELDASSIAILSARLQLNLYPATVGAKQYEEELVRNHLRMLYSVHDDLHTIITGSSPEPLIAEASAQIMHYTLPNGELFIKLWPLLWKYIDCGLAAQGATGELIGRALSISAMDRAINRLPNASVRELKYQTPVTVTDYYRALLTDEAWEELRHSTPANRAHLSSASANKTFEDAFKGGYFHFSHYGQANDASPMQNTDAWAYWLRGTAIACRLNQELTDRMIPIHFPHLGGVSPETISANLDQDRTGESVSPPTVSTQSAERLAIFPQGTKFPYIAAVHCYALTDHQGISVSKLSPRTKKLSSKSVDLEAPRYQIGFRGLSAYANIADAEKAIIRGMISRSKNAVFANHSRDYGVASVRRMLPLLTRHPASTGWFEQSNQAGPSMTASSGPEPLSPAKRLAASSQVGTREKKRHKK